MKDSLYRIVQYRTRSNPEIITIECTLCVSGSQPVHKAIVGGTQTFFKKHFKVSSI